MQKKNLDRHRLNQHERKDTVMSNLSNKNHNLAKAGSIPKSEDIATIVTTKPEIVNEQDSTRKEEKSSAETVTENKFKNKVVKIFQCHKCSKIFKWKHNFTKHTKMFHMDKNNGKINLQLKNQRQNGKNRNNEQSLLFSCVVCQRKFKWKHNLEKHMQIHSGDT